jgi:hypothetical protein
MKFFFWFIWFYEFFTIDFFKYSGPLCSVCMILDIHTIFGGNILGFFWYIIVRGGQNWLQNLKIQRRRRYCIYWYKFYLLLYSKKWEGESYIYKLWIVWSYQPYYLSISLVQKKLLTSSDRPIPIALSSWELEKIL